MEQAPLWVARLSYSEVSQLRSAALDHFWSVYQPGRCACSRGSTWIRETGNGASTRRSRTALQNATSRSAARPRDQEIWHRTISSARSECCSNKVCAHAITEFSV
eukprot:Mycagemm_TRINITY_DN8854_c0_g1::TRINITY_DN8854_c0_g1_i1::g.1847::m.1847 type:complete len:105 gc:universal TRINITY_DN8854_c0_g1_i1:60-374(+)